MKKYSILFLLPSFLMLNSCCNWNEDSKESYLKECEDSNISKEVCECTLEKLMDNYACYKEAMEHEEDFANIFIECN